MLNQFNSHTRHSIGKITIPKRYLQNLSTASLLEIQEPDNKKYITATKKAQLTNAVIRDIKELSTGSLETITKPADKLPISKVKESPLGRTVINTANIINNFHEEILQYSARYVKRNASWWNEENNSITFANTILDYGTEGPTSENFEVIINGIHQPVVYKVKQDGINIIVTFTERLFSYDVLQKENVIIIGKLLDIALLSENSVVITDEFGEALIL